MFPGKSTPLDIQTAHEEQIIAAWKALSARGGTAPDYGVERSSLAGPRKTDVCWTVSLPKTTIALLPPCRFLLVAHVLVSCEQHVEPGVLCRFQQLTVGDAH